MNTETISSFYSKNQRNLKIAHLNINSVRHKFHPISDMLNKSLINIMFIQETKLDSSFPSGQFHVDKYFTYRKDVSCNSGGIMAIVRSDLPQRRLYDFETVNVESSRVELLMLEVTLQKKNGIFVAFTNNPMSKMSNLNKLLKILFMNLDVMDLIL